MNGVVPSDIIDGKYEVLRPLGAGGMGQVFAAKHLELGHEVAIKLLLPNFAKDREVIARFKREAQIAARLRSKHVAKVHDFGEHQEQPFLVMELLTGADLKALVKTRGPLPEHEAINYVLQACEALVEAHEAGIVHRDLKPANLFCADDSRATPSVKILDFGIARLIDQSHDDDIGQTSTGVAIGSPSYMSPEQITSSRKVDARSDIWSLGVVLYYLVSARLPFEAASPGAICALVQRDPPTPITAVRADISEPLVKIIDRCLRKNPSQRFPDVRALVTALRVCLAGDEPQTTSLLTDESPPETHPSHENTATITQQHAPSPRLAPKPIGPDKPSRRRLLALGGLLVGFCFAIGFGVVARSRSLPPRSLPHLRVDGFFLLPPSRVERTPEPQDAAPQAPRAELAPPAEPSTLRVLSSLARRGAAPQQFDRRPRAAAPLVEGEP